MIKLKYIFSLLLICILSFSVFGQKTSDANFPKCTKYPKIIPAKKNVWIFIMAGQSNMAGRGFVEPMDTVTNQRILSINTKSEIILAKEPLNLYESQMKGLDCGVSFACELLKFIPDSVSILLIPTAVGGSSIDQWIGDSLHRKVNLRSNFRQKVELAKNFGEIKGLLWHQGESDAKQLLVRTYAKKLKGLFSDFRKTINDKKLPILTGEIGTFTPDSTFQNAINKAIVSNAKKDKHTFLIQTRDFTDKGDKLHFDSKSQRIMGERFAQKYLEIIKLKIKQLVQ
ncbi:MAG: sialate O-acetylesterase [Paludibacter sp.]|nr:sialate O-acetylesterase [Paludibacter sp.]